MAALRAAVFKLFAKNRWGGIICPPPVRVLRSQKIFYDVLRRKAQSYCDNPPKNGDRATAKPSI